MIQSQVIVGETYAVRSKGKLRPVEVLDSSEYLGASGGRPCIRKLFTVRFLDTMRRSELSAGRLLAPWSSNHDRIEDERCRAGLSRLGVVRVF